jgi:hypothetical protein
MAWHGRNHELDRNVALRRLLGLAIAGLAMLLLGQRMALASGDGSQADQPHDGDCPVRGCSALVLGTGEYLGRW